MRELLENWLNQEVWISAGKNLDVRAKVTDVKISYATARVLVTPINGRGQEWRNLDSVAKVKNA